MLFDRDTLQEALEELADRVAATGTAVQIRIVGGAAIAIGHGRETLTQDIDALFGTSPEVELAVAAIATERNWPPTWLNNAVRMFASDFDHLAEWVVHLQRGNVTVKIAPADLLLAMKLRAGRGRRDSGDIDLLLDACAVTGRAQAEAIFDRYYPQEIIAAGAERQLDVRFPSGP